MSEENGQETEIQETATEENNETVTDNAEDSITTENNDIDENQETTEESEEGLPSKDELDSLSDEEFEEYLNSGKLPDKQSSNNISESRAKIVSKPQKDNLDTNIQTEEKVSESIDYKAVYDTLFKPFKANGKEITPRTPQDIISLMQMGANYTKKMQLMAPMKRAVESLNKASIKEDDLNFLIDVFRGDKEAIKSLLKKHEIDPMDLDLDNIAYKSDNKNIASDSDVEFSDTLMDINDSLPQIQDILNNTWDEKSKNALLQDPNLMRALHEEIQLGRFGKVQQIVEQEKTFGRYKGMSDLEAYIDVVTKMVKEEQQKQAPKGNPIDPTQPSKTNSKQIPDKAKAAPTRSKQKSSKGSTLTAEDLFNMPEEEFTKLNLKDLV